MSLTRLFILVSIGLLLWLGLTALFSASMWNGEFWYHQQVHWVAYGLVAGLVAACVGYRPLGRLGVPWILYGVGVVLLVLVLIPGLGSWVNGARRWLWGVQPSEIAKPALMIVLAAYCSRRLPLMRQWKEGFFIPAILVLPVLVLTFREPDWGTTILLALVAAMILLLAGVPWPRLLLVGAVGFAGLAINLHFDAVRHARFLAFMDPERWKESYAWQPWLGILALGSGHWHGAGLGDGVLKLGFVPEQHTDCILTLIGEERGLAGTSLVVLAFAILLLCGALIAWRTSDPFARLLAAGITFLISLQAVMNIGVAVSVLPSKGIPLPFVSYGGSSIVTLLACVGLLLGIDARRTKGDDDLPVEALAVARD